MNATLFWLLPLATCGSLCLTWLLQRYALTHRLLDIPSQRSSHALPTPRGGGLAVVVTFFACSALLWTTSGLPSPWWIALLGASGFVALIGWLDDHRSVPVSVRLLGHALAAAWALFWLDVPPLVVAGPEYVAYALAALYIVWVLNLYNFMDGIDGIASIEAITVCLGGILLYVMAAPDSRDWMVPLLLIFCLAGFLYWNYPPARLFLGDSGSGFLGIVLALFSIRAGWVDPQLFWGWTVLLGVFIVDATVTLVRRVMSGRKFYVAHRSHAYQYASRKFGAHEPVALAVGAINLFWLLPLAMLVANDVLSVGIGLAIAYFPLFLLALWLKAGAEELKDT